jgi:hypothetical protein
MQLHIQRDGHCLPPSCQPPSTSVRVVAQADACGQGSVTFTVLELPDGGLSYSVKVVDATGYVITGRSERVRTPHPVPEALVPLYEAVEPSSDDAKALLASVPPPA